MRRTPLYSRLRCRAGRSGYARAERSETFRQDATLAGPNRRLPLSGQTRGLLRGLAGILLGAIGIMQPIYAFAQDHHGDVFAASLEDLTQMQIKVSSFSKQEEDLWLTPAAVYVISTTDIERSTASSIPELLRGVPGLQVQQINASYWAVTARGFDSEYASRLLVLVDGRTVYSEIYSGAHWDTIDLPLQDIERIEVIRGPGAVVWGSNAVNGVINIISKAARQEKGLLVTEQVGRVDEEATVQYAAALGERVHYRAFARYFDRKPLELATGSEAFDGAGTWRGGGRVDWQKSGMDWISTNGDVYGGHLKTQILPDFSPPGITNGMDHDTVGGGYAMSRWEHQSEESNRVLQVYYDEQSRGELEGHTRTRTIAMLESGMT
jgi:iron complex outermembrane receptor protein